MISLFIDTNILLHFKTFDEIDWSTISGDDSKLIIAPIVLDEIDKHKTHNNTKTARRAKMIADKFEQYIDNQQGKVNLQFLPKRPPARYFEEYQLDPRHQDDCLLASILQFREECPSESIRLITNDLGVKIRAATLQITIIKLGQELRLPEQMDEQAKQLETLKKEIASLKERIPKIKLCFKGKLQLFKHKIIKPTNTLETYQSTRLAEIKLETSYMSINEPYSDDDATVKAIQLFTGMVLSDERKKAYNKNLDEYYKDYSDYLRKYYEYAIECLHFVEVVFELINDGNTPADDIDVWIHLPDGFEVVESYPKEPSKPQPPYRPKHNFDMEPLNSRFLIPNLSFPGPSTYILDPNEPVIKKTNSYEITYHCKSVKHAMIHTFNRILLKYDDLVGMKNFQIDYRLNAANVPAPVEGQLNVVFESNDL